MMSQNCQFLFEIRFGRRARDMVFKGNLLTLNKGCGFHTPYLAENTNQLFISSVICCLIDVQIFFKL